MSDATRDNLIGLLFLLEEAIFSKDFSGLYTENPHIQPCWDLLQCKNKKCPAYGRIGQRCWQISGAFCKRESGEDNKPKHDCRKCKVFLEATGTKELRFRELINNIVFSLSCFDPSSLKEMTIKKHFDQLGADFHLTTREKEVLLLLLDRLPRKQIARRLSISSETVKMHIQHIYKKLEVTSREATLEKLLNLSTEIEKSKPALDPIEERLCQLGSPHRAHD